MKGKKMIALLLCCALLMSIITTASAITLKPSPGSTASSASVVKNSGNEPYVYVSGYPTEVTVGYFNCRIRMKNANSTSTTAATPNYMIDCGGEKSFYYLPGMNQQGESYIIRTQCGDNETNTLTINLIWNP